MTSPVKPAGSRAESLRGSGLYRVAIVGASTLKGKEVAEVLNDRNFPALDIKLLDDDEALGQLENVGDEVTFIQKARAEEFRNMDFTFFASDPGSAGRMAKLAQDAGSTIVDLSFGLEGAPGAVVRSPWIERQRGQAVIPQLQPGPAVIAHPAAVVLAMLLLRIQKSAAVRRAVAIAFEPASEHGQKGMDELHEQTVNLLSFQQLPKAIFDTQVAFNMVARYGERSAPPLSQVESRVQRHYHLIAGDDAPTPSILLLQAPIFHGHAFALNIEIDQPADIEKISQALSGEHVNVTHGAEDAPTNVNAAGQANIQVSITADAGHPSAFWVWAASDNLRIAASTAVECAETMTSARPRGKIQ